MSTELVQKSSFVVIVVDIVSLVNSVLTKAQDFNADAAVEGVLGALAVFSSSLALIHRGNWISIVCVTSNGSFFCFPRSSGDFAPVLHELGRDVTTALREAVVTQLQYQTNNETSTPQRSAISQAFSLALSVLNRHKDMQSRILVVQFDRDRSLNYNAVMNCIFSAQKLGVLVDALVVASFDSHLLQQACFLTGGIYLRHADSADLLQVLLTHFLADAGTRPFLSLPQQRSVDFKASCHCHQRPVEFAYMCSVCLTLTCQPAEDRCTVCLTAARGGAGAAKV